MAYVKLSYKMGIRLEEWLKWYSSCLTSVRPWTQTPVPPKKVWQEGIEYNLNLWMPKEDVRLTGGQHKLTIVLRKLLFDHLNDQFLFRQVTWRKASVANVSEIWLVRINLVHFKFLIPRLLYFFLDNPQLSIFYIILINLTVSIINYKHLEAEIISLIVSFP
jgi:hypothetical protein